MTRPLPQLLRFETVTKFSAPMPIHHCRKGHKSMNERVESLNDLKQWCARVFNDGSLEFSALGDDLMMFTVQGKAKVVQAKILPNTYADAWEDMEGGQWNYRDESMNLLITLRSVPSATLVMASVMSLSIARMKKHQPGFMAAIL